jgi:hypothetical protein
MGGKRKGSREEKRKGKRSGEIILKFLFFFKRKNRDEIEDRGGLGEEGEMRGRERERKSDGERKRNGNRVGFYGFFMAIYEENKDGREGREGRKE